jgi:signal transduction histidine kinase
MLGFLRREGEQPDDLAPQPRLGQLDALLSEVAGGALDVQVVECGTPRELPPTVEVSAYRIVQEALTNVLKHSTAERVVVRLVYEPSSFAVEITDDGRPREAARPAGGGHGVLGMRERATLHRGELVAAPLDSGGYRVRATFPLEAAVR